MNMSPSLHKVDLSLTIPESDYKKKLKDLQEKARQVTHECQTRGKSIAVVFEGWDAAGKGGAIRRLTGLMDPRLYEVHNISAPDASEKSRNYLWRFWRRIPERGVIGIFDRSWYGRVMVERVEGFATEAEWKRAYSEIIWFEESLEQNDVKVIKFFIHIDKDTQKERFDARANDPLKRWKLTDEDWRNRDKWDLYVDAVEEMLVKTHTESSPWVVVSGNDKLTARIQILEEFVKFGKKI
ncbi:UDP-galactose-lipid carrier transferase [Leptospira sp. GIMC2001]|uniref:UDP-galactose-lipid carrier transferase n=1 Tax=Leptospira sp. GIMC2001 TaxID=1513297 RepID=UPI00234AC64B|nr:UDP-galactose-lipid carrier transferase [Leptospira sp. GIMC2001]WCL48095.1 UDP-galactose-lipid carrier transferase [Leptospira sp. GIMC2001]